jgi:hypothetical protein
MATGAEVDVLVCQVLNNSTRLAMELGPHDLAVSNEARTIIKDRQFFLIF